LNFPFIKRNLKKLHHDLKKNAAQFFSKFLKIKMLLEEKNQQIRMISEGSCVTKDWSNCAENSAFPA